MPDLKDYIDKDHVVVKAHARRKPQRSREKNASGCIVIGVVAVAMWLLLKYVFNPVYIWLGENFILALIILLILTIASIIGIVVYKRNKQKRTDADDE